MNPKADSKTHVECRTPKMVENRSSWSLNEVEKKEKMGKTLTYKTKIQPKTYQKTLSLSRSHKQQLRCGACLYVLINSMTDFECVNIRMFEMRCSFVQTITRLLSGIDLQMNGLTIGDIHRDTKQYDHINFVIQDCYQIHYSFFSLMFILFVQFDIQNKLLQ